MIMTEMDIETSGYYVHLTRLIAREDFIKIQVVVLWAEDEDGGSMILRDIGILPHHHTVS
jgi:hypothetical protein